MNILKKINIPLFSSFFLSLYALYLRVVNYSQRELWTDERFQIRCILDVKKPFWMHNNYGDHTSFPGEYLLNYPLMHFFGAEKWALLVPHFCVTVLGFYFLYKLCQVYLKTSLAYVVTFLVVAVNTSLVFHSFEFRPYAVLPTLFLGAIYYINRVITVIPQMSKVKKFFVGVFLFIVVNYHIYGLILFGLAFMYNWVDNRVYKKKWEDVKKIVNYFTVVLAVALPVWGWYASSTFMNISDGTQAAQSIQNTFQFIPNPLTQPVGFLRGVLGNLIGQKILYPLLLGCFLAVVLKNKNKTRQIVFFLFLVLMPLSIILAIDIIRQYWFIQRQFVWVMPAFALLLGWCWDSVFLKFKRAPNQAIDSARGMC